MSCEPNQNPSHSQAARYWVSKTGFSSWCYRAREGYEKLKRPFDMYPSRKEKLGTKSYLLSFRPV